MSVSNAINGASALLPGMPAADGEDDPRWQAIIQIASFIETNPEEVWRFVVSWGGHEQEDLRNAIACVLLEHLLEFHFDLIFPRVEATAKTDSLFWDTFCRCWKFGQSEIPANAAKFDALKERCRDQAEG